MYNSRDVEARPVELLSKYISLISSRDITPEIELYTWNCLFEYQYMVSHLRYLLHNPERSIADVLSNVELTVVYYHPLVIVPKNG